MNIKNQHVYQQGDRSVQIVVYDPIIDEKQTQSKTLQTQAAKLRSASSRASPAASPTASPTASPSPLTTIAVTTTQFIGGHGNHRFNITCKSIPTEGVNESVVHVFKGKYAL